MRTITSYERDILKQRHYNVHMKVYVADAEGNMRDLSNFYGYDWCESVRWGMQLDSPVMNGSVVIRREISGVSLSPLVYDSPANNVLGYYSPLIHANREIKILTATVLPGNDPSAHWKSVFEGKIDRVDWGGRGGKITLAVRDKGAYLLDYFIMDERSYTPTPPDEATLVEDVIQQILNDNGFGSVVLNMSGGSPGWAIGPFTQIQERLLTAIRKLAMQIGWVVRYRYNSSDQFVLDLFDPQRSKVAVDFTLEPSEYIDVVRLNLSDTNVRNFIRIKFYNSAIRDVDETYVTNNSSINEFGYRYMEIQESEASAIDTLSEAVTMAYAALSDLSIPKADHEIETLYWWPVQIGDLSVWTANQIHYDSNQTWAVVGFDHEISANRHRTKILTRGHPAGAYSEWLTRGPQLNKPQVSVAGDWIPTGKGIIEETYEVWAIVPPNIYPSQY